MKRKKKKVGEQYVRGFLCKCGRIYPENTPFPPFLKLVPTVCPRCGCPVETMEKRSILIEKYESGRWIFKTEHYKYLPGKKFPDPVKQFKHPTNI